MMTTCCNFLLYAQICCVLFKTDNTLSAAWFFMLLLCKRFVFGWGFACKIKLKGRYIICKCHPKRSARVSHRYMQQGKSLKERESQAWMRAKRHVAEQHWKKVEHKLCVMIINSTETICNFQFFSSTNKSARLVFNKSCLR